MNAIRIFISHNVADANAARRVGLYLVAEGFDVWYDEWRLQAGDSLVGSVDAALGMCSHFVLIWSARAAKSRWVTKELRAALARAIDEGHPRIIPVRLDDDEPLPPLLSDLVWIRLEDGHEEARAQAIEAITGKKPELAFARSLVELFNEVIVTDFEHGVEWNYCPKCGSDTLEKWAANNEERGEGSGFTRCRDCHYQEETASW